MNTGLMNPRIIANDIVGGLSQGRKRIDNKIMMFSHD